jgi:hypothetical protein
MKLRAATAGNPHVKQQVKRGGWGATSSSFSHASVKCCRSRSVAAAASRTSSSSARVRESSSWARAAPSAARARRAAQRSAARSNSTSLSRDRLPLSRTQQQHISLPRAAPARPATTQRPTLRAERPASPRAPVGRAPPEGSCAGGLPTRGSRAARLRAPSPPRARQPRARRPPRAPRASPRPPGSLPPAAARVRLVREEGRGVSSQYWREGVGGLLPLA